MQVLSAPQRNCLLNPAWCKAHERESSSSEELRLLEKVFDELHESQHEQSVDTDPSSLSGVFEHENGHIRVDCRSGSAQLGWGLPGDALVVSSSTWRRERLCADQPCASKESIDVALEVCMFRWADLQGQLMSFRTCTHPVFTQTFHADL